MPPSARPRSPGRDGRGERPNFGSPIQIICNNRRIFLSNRIANCNGVLEIVLAYIVVGALQMHMTSLYRSKPAGIFATFKHNPSRGMRS